MSHELDFDLPSSTVLIAGTRFPVVVPICPATDHKPDESEQDRALFDATAYIPAENGLIFEVDPWDRLDARPTSLLTMGIVARACNRYYSGEDPDDPWIWLPHRIGILNGDFVSLDEGDGRRRRQLLTDAAWDWRRADPEWVVEMIQRLSRKPFAQPAGPLMQFVRRGTFER